MIVVGERVERREAEDGGVPCYGGFKVGDVESDVVQHPVARIGFKCHFGTLGWLDDFLGTALA